MIIYINGATTFFGNSHPQNIGFVDIVTSMVPCIIDNKFYDCVYGFYMQSRKDLQYGNVANNYGCYETKLTKHAGYVLTSEIRNFI